MTELPRRWYSAGSNARLWGGRGTYAEVPYDWLPSLDASRHDGTFAWLDEAPEHYGLQYGLDEEEPVEDEVIAARLDALLADAKRERLTVPKSFCALLANRERYGPIPTCTSCYVELGARLVEVRGTPGRLLRFMNDQQCVLVWCLHLLPHGEHRVVVARPRFIDDATGDSLEEVAELADPTTCADDFEAFVHRFFLENTLWYATNAGRTLTAEEALYVEGAQEHMRQ